jgi:AcrR family transcriptional regulator
MESLHNSPNLAEEGPDAIRQPREQRRSEREAAIVAAAIEEFCSAGLAGTRLEQVAQRAGVAKGTIYLYFDNKEELFKAAVRTLIHPLMERIESDIAEFQGSTEDLLRGAIVRAHADMTERPQTREVLRLMIAEGHRMPDLAEFFYRETIARGLATVRMILWRGIAQGEFHQSPAAEFPQLIIAPCMMASVWMLLLGDAHPLDMEKYSAAHASFIIAALRAQS